MSNEQLRDDFVENDIPDSVDKQRCPQCNVENSSEYRYCPNCGKALILSWESVQEYIIANLPQHISKVLETNYKNQTVVEIETAMLISERILKWSKLAATVLGIPLLVIGGFVSFIGIKSYADLSATLKSMKELEQQVKNGMDQFKPLQNKISELKTQSERAQEALNSVQKQQDEFKTDIKELRKRVGGLSDKYEIHGRGPGSIERNIDDPGGKSYGSYSFTSNPDGGGIVKIFVADPEFRWRKEFVGLVPGSTEFDAKWKAISGEDSESFFDEQHDFVMRRFYDPIVKRLKEETGIDLQRQSMTLQDVLWSVSVQHGPNNKIVLNALSAMQKEGTANPKLPEFDQKLIKAIYDERMRKNESGNLVHFSKNSQEVQLKVLNRFQDELARALEKLKSEKNKLD
jgi:FtsZ-binding cell division protein ZapB